MEEVWNVASGGEALVVVRHLHSGGGGCILGDGSISRRFPVGALVSHNLAACAVAYEFGRDGVDAQRGRPAYVTDVSGSELRRAGAADAAAVPRPDLKRTAWYPSTRAGTRPLTSRGVLL